MNGIVNEMEITVRIKGLVPGAREREYWNLYLFHVNVELFVAQTIQWQIMLSTLLHKH